MAHVPEVAFLLKRGRVRAGTIDSFLIWRLTAGKHHVTDHSNASRTMLLDLPTLDWDTELLDIFGLPRDVLPRLVPSCGVVGETDSGLLGAPVSIAGVAGDQQGALFGQGAFCPGDCKNTYGTGCFLLMNAGTRPVPATHGILSTVAWTVVPWAETKFATNPGTSASPALESASPCDREAMPLPLRMPWRARFLWPAAPCNG